MAEFLEEDQCRVEKPNECTSCSRNANAYKHLDRHIRLIRCDYGIVPDMSFFSDLKTYRWCMSQ